MRKKTFKDYQQNQLSMLPPSLDELIDKKHLVRVIDSVINGVDYGILSSPFKDKGQPPYDPRMMMKVLVYAYATKLYSTRKIEKALKQDITYMWISGNEKPDHNTINRFRSVYFKDIMEEVFTHVLDYLRAEKYVKFETFFVDGTKLEADAGKYTHVWRKNIARYKEQLRESVRQLLKEINEINQQEDSQYGDNSLPELGSNEEVDSTKLKTIVDDLNNDLKKNAEKKLGKKAARSVESRIKKIEKKSEKLQQYEENEKVLNGRNSYSKTDTDASMMRMKGSDELRPGYNQQISTEGQFIVNYSVHPNSSDAPTFVPHLQKILNRGDDYLPLNYVGDAAYGSEENYHALAQAEIESYLQYSTFYREITGKHNNPFHKDNMEYDADGDFFICPAQKRITYDRTEERVTENGYTTQVKIYRCKSCEGCHLKEKCTKSEHGRSIQVREKLEEYKEKARDNLTSNLGVKLRNQRGWDVETIFGDQKHNQGYKRIRLRGADKAEVELGLLSISYNLRKVHIAKLNKN
jgi:transposase